MEDTRKAEKTVVILQPSYLPWLGFFDQLLRCDAFVFYDDVPYDKHGWRSRNRVKAPEGARWLTIPVLHKGRGSQKIHEVEIDRRVPWARKHMTTLWNVYAKAPYAGRYLPELEGVLRRPWFLLADVDIAVTMKMCEWLGIRRQLLRSSEMRVEGLRSERLLDICRRLAASTYLSGDAARDYLDVKLFQDAGIRVVWQDYQHPAYPQLHGPFMPYLSAIDLILNAGERSVEILSSPSVASLPVLPPGRQQAGLKS